MTFVIPFPSIDPVLISFGPIAIRWYSLAYIAGLVLGWMLLRRLVLRTPDVAGLDDAALDACLQDGEKARTLVAWFQENAEADDVTGTPSFVIDGEKVSNQPYADFAALFDEKLGE